MSDELDSLVEAFDAACYGPLAEHYELGRQVEGMDELLTLIEPHRIRTIILESCKNLTDLLSACYKGIKNSTSILEIIQFKNEFETLLHKRFSYIENRIDRFDSKLSTFRNSLRSWNQEIKNNGDETFWGAVGGGILGGLLLGPLGAILGGICGGASNSDDSAENEGARELKNLIGEYEALLSDTKRSLDECLEIAKAYFIEIAQNIIEEKEVKRLQSEN